MEEIITSEMPVEKTLDVKKIVGSNVLSRRGVVIGKVNQVNMNPKDMKVEGITIKKPFFRKNLYIGKEYFQKLSETSIILNIEPAPLVKGKKVISFEGKKIGKIEYVERKEKTNNIKNLVVRTTFRKRFRINKEHIKYFGKTIILKENYEPPKTKFWKK